MSLFADWRANPRNPRIRLMLAWLRAVQAVHARTGSRLAASLLEVPYRLVFEWGMGIELRPKTQIGSGLTIHHGTGLVVNDASVIGSGVTLRNGVTIGNREEGGGCPVIGDRVEIGAGAILLGPITVGDGARIGAGAVVLADVPAGGRAVGNPARLLP